MSFHFHVLFCVVLGQLLIDRGVWSKFCIFLCEGLPLMLHRCYSVFICRNWVQYFANILHSNSCFSIGNQRWSWVMQAYIILWGVWRVQREYDFIITGENSNRGNCEKLYFWNSELALALSSCLALLLFRIIYSTLCQWIFKLIEVLNGTVYIPIYTSWSYPRRCKSSLQLWECGIAHVVN